MNIYITAIIEAKSTQRQYVQNVLQHMVRETKKEEACLQYDLHQDNSDPNLFIFYEIWRDQQGLVRHNQQPYIKEFGTLVDSKLQKRPSIYNTENLIKWNTEN